LIPKQNVIKSFTDVFANFRGQPYSEISERCFTWLGSSLTLNHWTRLERLVGEKHSSLFARSIINEEKSFITLIPVTHFIKLFWLNLCSYRCIGLGLDLGYVFLGINDAKKSSMKLTPGANVIKLFSS
jgi:hypothetical protein